MEFNIAKTIFSDSRQDLTHPIISELVKNIDRVAELLDQSIWVLIAATDARFPEYGRKNIVNWIKQIKFQPAFLVHKRQWGMYYPDDRVIEINLSAWFEDMPGGLSVPDATRERLDYGDLPALIGATMAHELEHDIQTELTGTMEEYRYNIPWNRRPQEYTADMSLANTMLDQGMSDVKILNMLENGFTPDEAKSILEQVKHLRETEGSLPLMTEGRAWSISITAKRV